MAVTAPRARPWSPGRVPTRLLAVGLALALALAGAYVLIAGNPFNRAAATPTYQTTPASLGSVQTTVSATGPITFPASVPLSFKSSGKLTEVDVAVGQTVTAGQVAGQRGHHRPPGRGRSGAGDARAAAGGPQQIAGRRHARSCRRRASPG